MGEGTVKFADGSVFSLECYDERHGDCPDDHSDASEGNGSQDGYNCECSCSGADTNVADTADMRTGFARDASALDAITRLMNGNEWDADLINLVADVVRGTGRDVSDEAAGIDFADLYERHSSLEPPV